MVSRPITVYIDASLMGGDTSVLESVRNLAEELEIRCVVLGDISDLPDDFADAWHLTDAPPASGSPRWSRTVVVGPRIEPGRRPLSGLRHARDVRVALIELASEHAID